MVQIEPKKHVPDRYLSSDRLTVSPNPDNIYQIPGILFNQLPFFPRPPPPPRPPNEIFNSFND